MAMVETRVFSGVLLGIGMLMLAGCIFGHGPNVANALDVPIQVIVGFVDGEIENTLFKPGISMGIGKGDWDNKPWKVIPIEEVVIKEAGRVLHQFNAEEVRLLIEKQRDDWGTWCIDREKVYLVRPPDDFRGPDLRKGCSKGKRFWTWQNG